MLKKRSKNLRTSDRRSKSVEHRRRRKVVKIQPRSKDDLDFGTFTVIGRPPNPWTLENSLRRGKSLPNMTEASTSTNPEERLHQDQAGSIETSSVQGSSQTIMVQSSELQTSSILTSGSNEQYHQERSSVKVNVVAGKKMELMSKTMTELNVGELKRYFQECLITIKTSQEEKNTDVKSDRQCIDDLTRSFENLVEIIGLREDMLLSQLSPPQQLQQQHHQQQRNQSKRIKINFQTEDILSVTMNDNNSSMIDIFERSIDLVQDFLNQLLPDVSQDENNIDDDGEDEPGFRTMIGKEFRYFMNILKRKSTLSKSKARPFTRQDLSRSNSKVR